MIVVADSSPLHYLILVDRIDLLHRLYGHVFVPDAVVAELQSARSPAMVSAWMEHPPVWATIAPVSPEQIATVTQDLDLGERAAIALAGAIHADLLLIDDAAGRAEARRRHLRVTGTLGVLRAGAERGIVDVPVVLSRLKATSFYADEALINTIFARWLST